MYLLVFTAPNNTILADKSEDVYMKTKLTVFLDHVPQEHSSHDPQENACLSNLLFPTLDHFVTPSIIYVLNSLIFRLCLLLTVNMTS